MFSHRREELAIEALRLSVTPVLTSRKGPLDTKKEVELNKIEDRIRRMVEEGQIGPVLVDYAIEAARLSR